MKTIGKYIKDARVKKRYSKSRVEKLTKIKGEFIEAIEKETWSKLPDFPVVVGFVKSIARVLKIDEKQATALLRRDYPPKELHVNPKPDVSDKFRWSPRVTFIAGVVAVLLFTLGYLGFEYYKFVSPPSLTVNVPKENQEITQSPVTVSGSTTSDATIKVNNQPVLVDDNGNFTTQLEVTNDTKQIVVEAISRSGKETTIHRNIEPKL
jgi:cytoskeletal protein RodZ